MSRYYPRRLLWRECPLSTRCSVRRWLTEGGWSAGHSETGRRGLATSPGHCVDSPASPARRVSEGGRRFDLVRGSVSQTMRVHVVEVLRRTSTQHEGGTELVATRTARSRTLAGRWWRNTRSQDAAGRSASADGSWKPSRRSDRIGRYPAAGAGSGCGCMSSCCKSSDVVSAVLTWLTRQSFVYLQRREVGKLKLYFGGSAPASEFLIRP